MQETDISSGRTSTSDWDQPGNAPMKSDDASSSADALRMELAKWRERVPRLASALKVRTDEVEALKSQLDARKALPAAGDKTHGSAIQARDDLIEELETKVRSLGTRYQDAEGQIRSRDVEVSALRQEAQEWRDKWQSMTASLDQQSDSFAEKDLELKALRNDQAAALRLQERQSGIVNEQELELTRLRESCRSLESRNEKLFETTELANRQIETLGGNLETLRTDLKASRELAARRAGEAEGRGRQIEDLTAQMDSRDQTIESLNGLVEEQSLRISTLSEQMAEQQGRVSSSSEQAEDERRRLEGQLEARGAEVAGLTARLVESEALNKTLVESAEARDAQLSDMPAQVSELDGERRALEKLLSEQKREVRRLEECVARADETNSQWEIERRELSEQMVELKKRNDHLEAQLAERSDLVMGLEQEKGSISDRTQSLEEDNRRLAEALEKSERGAGENADHIAHLDSRLDRQKQLMEDLEKEFAQLQEEHADAIKVHQRTLSEKVAQFEAYEDQQEQHSAQLESSRVDELESVLAEVRNALAVAEQNGIQQERRAEKLASALDDQQMAGTSAVEDDSLNASLKAEVIKLEAMVRDRTEELNKVRWRQDMADMQADEGAGSKMLVVLNQQLASAREDNQRLLEKIRELEMGQQADDLSAIRGIGPKLGRQLAELGINSFDQIAILTEADLDEAHHPLHAMKGRILKDRWITQAARLAGP